MRSFAAAVVAIAVAFTLKAGAQAQDKKDAPRAKVVLSAPYSMLDLTAEQRFHVGRIQAKYKEKLDKLTPDEQKKQLTALHAAEREEIIQLLTPSQKVKLQELTKSADPKKDADPKKSADPKKDKK